MIPDLSHLRYSHPQSELPYLIRLLRNEFNFIPFVHKDTIIIYVDGSHSIDMERGITELGVYFEDLAYINLISAGIRGDILNLICLTDGLIADIDSLDYPGGNIHLGGDPNAVDFPPKKGDTLSLIRGEVDWFELSRSLTDED